ncbi:MAG TPA: hypothetical protein VEU52_07595 [Candidatus Limnocylindrales bacterium]|nr:hypothetical protein [Candidatus Limnocylindrales bacterium]
MNYKHIVLAAVASLVADLAFGYLYYGFLIANEYNPYPGVYRSSEVVKNYMPFGFAGILIGLIILSVIYAKGYEGGSGLAEGARFGILIGIFVAVYFVGTNFTTLNIGPRLAAVQAAGALIEWTLVGIVIGLVYKPAHPSTRAAS